MIPDIPAGVRVPLTFEVRICDAVRHTVLLDAVDYRGMFHHPWMMSNIICASCSQRGSPKSLVIKAREALGFFNRGYMQAHMFQIEVRLPASWTLASYQSRTNKFHNVLLSVY